MISDYPRSSSTEAIIQLETKVVELHIQVMNTECNINENVLPMRELRDEYEDTRRILSIVSKERMYSSLSGLPRVLLALLLVLKLPGEKAAGPPE